MPTKESEHQPMTRAGQVLAIQQYVLFIAQTREFGTNSGQSPVDTAVDQGSGFLDIESYSPIHFSTPMTLGVLSQKCAGLISRAVVINSQESGMGVRAIDGDERNAR
jgi:hypothetical protein